MDETTLYSDLILPESTFLERWESTMVSSSVGRAAFGVRQPVVKPLYDTKSSGDVIMRLAKKIGKPMSDSLPWKDSEQFIKERIRGVQESGRGSIVITYSKKFWNKLLTNGGWWETNNNFDESEKKFNTPSGKFEFYSQIMKKEFENTVMKTGEKPVLENVPKGDKMFMPHYEPPHFHGNKKEFPLTLIPFPTAALGSGGGANQPYIQEIFGALHRLTGESWVEINPDMAKRLHIADNDTVWIESSRGKIKAIAKIYPGSVPDVIFMPLGQGHTAYGQFAKGRGVTPLSVLEKQFDPISGAQVLSGTRVKVYKA
jgi:anaerobic selenocysteine-containing dehydrogenase